MLGLGPHSSIADAFILAFILFTMLVATIGYLWSPYGIGQTIIFSSCRLFYLSSVFLFFPRLFSAAADWMSAVLPHMVWP